MVRGGIISLIHLRSKIVRIKEWDYGKENLASESILFYV